MLKIIRNLLNKIIEDIDAGNSNLSEQEAIEAIEYIKQLTDKDKRFSKYQACQYLNVSRATFDNYVRDGLITKGKKEAGFKELSWKQKDLDILKKQLKNDKSKN